MRTIADVSLVKFGTRKIAGFGKSSEDKPTYKADIVIDGHVFPNVLVVASDDFKADGDIWALVGRDILNAGIVLDGPKQEYRIEASSPSQD